MADVSRSRHDLEALRASAAPARYEPKTFTPGNQRANAGASVLRRFDARDCGQIFDEIARFDSYGPGVVGSINDLVSNTVSRLTPIVEVRFSTSDGWLQMRDEASLEKYGMSKSDIETISRKANEVVYSYDDGWSTFAQTLRRQSRLLLVRGECYVYHARNGQIHIISPAEVRVENGTWLWTRGDNLIEEPFIAGDKSRVWRIWEPDPDFPDYPWTRWTRVLGHIRELVSALRRQKSDADSALFRDLLVFPAAYSDVNLGADQESVDNGVIDILKYAAELYQRDADYNYGDIRSVGANGPLVMFKPDGSYGDKVDDPKLISFMSAIDEHSFRLVDQAMTAIGQSFGIPKQYLESGGLSSKFSNVDFLEQGLLDRSVDPLAEICFSGITKFHFAPTVLKGLKVSSVNDLEVRLGYDTKELLPRRNRGEDVYRGVRIGAYPASRYAEEMGIDPMILPDDVSEYDQWLMGIGADRHTGIGEPEGGSGDVSSTGSSETMASLELPSEVNLPSRKNPLAVVSFALFNCLHAEVVKIWSRNLNTTVKNREERAEILKITKASGITRAWFGLNDIQAKSLVEANSTLENIVDGIASDIPDLMSTLISTCNISSSIVDSIFASYRDWTTRGIEPTAILMEEKSEEIGLSYE